MRLVSFDGGRLGVMAEDGVVEITDLAGVSAGAWPPVGMVRLIAEFDALRPQIAARIASAPRLDPVGLRLEAPVQWPNKVIAYPANYQAHIEGSGQNMGVIFVVAARAKVSSLRVGLPWTYGLQSKRPSTTGRSALISLTAFLDHTG